MKAAIAVLAVFLFAPAPALALTRGETRKVVETVVVEDLARPLTPRVGVVARHRVYGCRRGSCRFWVKGSSYCAGTVRVAEGRYKYAVWFTELSCRPSSTRRGARPGRARAR